MAIVNRQVSARCRRPTLGYTVSFRYLDIHLQSGGLDICYGTAEFKRSNLSLWDEGHCDHEDMSQVNLVLFLSITSS